MSLRRFSISDKIEGQRDGQGAWEFECLDTNGWKHDNIEVGHGLANNNIFASWAYQFRRMWKVAQK